jgi:hypothetical protein
MSVKQLEGELAAREQALKDALSVQKPNESIGGYYRSELDKCRSRIEEYEHAKDYDVKALESRSMELEDRAYGLRKRMNDAPYGSDRWKSLYEEHEKVSREISGIDQKLYERRQYDKWSKKHADIAQALRDYEANKARDEAAYRTAQESLPQLVKERNAAIRALSEAQPFAPDVRAKLGDGYADAMERIVEAASKRHPEIAAAYRMFSSVLKIGDSELGKGAFYRPATKSIYFNAGNVARGNSYETPYETAFHEFGHLIDNVSMYESKHLGAENGLGEAIRSDWVKFRNAVGKADGVSRDKNGHTIRMLEREMAEAENGTVAYSNVSDIIEGCTKQSYPLGFGHGANYHKREGATASEFVAELFDSAMANEDSYRQMRRIFPTATELVEGLVRELTS